MKIDRKQYIRPEIADVLVEHEAYLITHSIQDGATVGDMEEPDDPDPWG